MGNLKKTFADAFMRNTQQDTTIDQIRQVAAQNPGVSIRIENPDGTSQVVNPVVLSAISGVPMTGPTTGTYQMLGGTVGTGKARAEAVVASRGGIGDLQVGGQVFYIQPEVLRSKVLFTAPVKLNVSPFTISGTIEKPSDVTFIAPAQGAALDMVSRSGSTGKMIIPTSIIGWAIKVQATDLLKGGAQVDVSTGLMWGDFDKDEGNWIDAAFLQGPAATYALDTSTSSGTFVVLDAMPMADSLSEYVAGRAISSDTVSVGVQTCFAYNTQDVTSAESLSNSRSNGANIVLPGVETMGTNRFAAIKASNCVCRVYPIYLTPNVVSMIQEYLNSDGALDLASILAEGYEI